MDHSLPTAATLSRWLRESGALPRGDVADVKLDVEHKTDISKLVFLTATYSHDAPGDLPSRLVVKSVLVHPNPADYDRAELRFYREFAPHLGTPPALRCLAVVEDEGELSGTVVLEDVRATHHHRSWPIPPSRIESEMAIDALAQVHVKWWETTEQPHTVQSLTSMVNGIAAHLPGFMDTFETLLRPTRDQSTSEYSVPHSSRGYA